MSNTPAPRAPQDHKAKEVKVLPEQTPGWDLLKPFAEIPVWDQTDLLETLTSVSSSHAGGEVSETKMVGLIAKHLMEFALDRDAYAAFVSGPRGIANAAPLVKAWIGQLGEIAPSVS